MQAQLLDSLFGTQRGMSASSEVRAEINELITQLEAKSPNSDMAEVSCRHPSLTPDRQSSHDPWSEMNISPWTATFRA